MIFLFLPPGIQIPDWKALSVDMPLLILCMYFIGNRTVSSILNEKSAFLCLFQRNKYIENPLLPFTLAPPHCVFKNIQQNGILIALLCRAVHDIQTMKKTFLCMEQKQQTRERNRWKSKRMLGSLSAKVLQLAAFLSLRKPQLQDRFLLPSR